ncbi:MAG TPA: hypothetical protein VJ385_03560 [Fibrobacteria bacterium]|nr:hypothetical protein [Fibrobacteria bacterium]
MEDNLDGVDLRALRAQGDFPGTWEDAGEARSPVMEGIPESLDGEYGCYDRDHAGGCG